MATSSTPSPAQVKLNLDTLEREQVRGLPKKKPEPYTVEIGGRVLVFTDPIEIDAAILMRMEETPGRFFSAALSGEDLAHMLKVFETEGALPGWKLQALLQGYQDYYGLDSMGNVLSSRR